MKRQTNSLDYKGVVHEVVMWPGLTSGEVRWGEWGRGFQGSGDAYKQVVAALQLCWGQPSWAEAGASRQGRVPAKKVVLLQFQQNSGQTRKPRHGLSGPTWRGFRRVGTQGHPSLAPQHQV